MIDDPQDLCDRIHGTVVKNGDRGLPWFSSRSPHNQAKLAAVKEALLADGRFTIEPFEPEWLGMTVRLKPAPISDTPAPPWDAPSP